MSKDSIRIIIKNNILIENCKLTLQRKIKKDLSFVNPAYAKAKRIGKRMFGIKRNLYLFNEIDDFTIEIPAGYKNYLISSIEEMGYKYTIIDKRRVSEALLEWEKELGDGEDYEELEIKDLKTIVIPNNRKKDKYKIIANYVTKTKNKFLFVATNKMEFYEAQEELTELLGCKIGLLGDRNNDLQKEYKGHIATIQTLKNRKGAKQFLNRNVGLCIFDNLHEMAPNYFEVLNELQMKYKLGVTKFIQRDDLADYLFDVYIAPPENFLKEKERELIKGELPKVIVKYTGYEKNDSIVINKKSFDFGGESTMYSELIGDLYSDEKRNTLIVDYIKSRSNDNVAMVVVKRREHGEELAKALGCRCLHIKSSGAVKKEVSVMINNNTLKMVVVTERLINGGFTFDGLTTIYNCAAGKGARIIEHLIGALEGVEGASYVDFVDIGHETLKKQWYERRKKLRDLGLYIPPKKSTGKKFNLRDYI